MHTHRVIKAFINLLVVSSAQDKKGLKAQHHCSAYTVFFYPRQIWEHAVSETLSQVV